MSVFLGRHAPLVNLQLEVATSLDGQGKPTYATAVTIHGRSARTDTVSQPPGGIKAALGREEQIVVTVWIPATESVLPRMNDRMTLPDGLVGIVVERSEVRALRSTTLDHVRVKLREQ